MAGWALRDTVRQILGEARDGALSTIVPEEWSDRDGCAADGEGAPGIGAGVLRKQPLRAVGYAYPGVTAERGPSG
ncbi:hypothetical protein GCM10027595_11600 [Corynebacterium nasicanis]